ncbi:MAG: hypothetical protein JW770_05655, partial [Actinobacteria bacterium]|nr:hypothetical protein [Actinomycetota bacterium]
MNRLSKYIKIAKEAVVKPGDDIEDRIIGRIENLDEKDSSLLDESFLDFFRKHNSLLYFAGRKLKDRPGFFIFLIIFIIVITA